MIERAMRAILAASSPTRSKLAVVLEMAMSKRRSRAVGWRRAMIEDKSRSISISIALTRASATATSSAASKLRLESALIAPRIWDSTSPPISMTWDDTEVNSESNWVERCLSGIGFPHCVNRDQKVGRVQRELSRNGRLYSLRSLCAAV